VLIYLCLCVYKELERCVVQAHSLPGQTELSSRGVSQEGSHQLFHMVSMQRAARESAEIYERVSKAVIDRPGIFQLMAQVNLHLFVLFTHVCRGTRLHMRAVPLPRTSFVVQFRHKHKLNVEICSQICQLL
jgi:hypothetical protein